jgi:hypothetical protein
MVFPAAQIAEIVAHIEASGGHVGGLPEQESMHRALEYAVQGWLRQSAPGLTVRDAETLGGRVRMAVRNVDDLLKHLRTPGAAMYAIRVEQDLHRFGQMIQFRTALHWGDLEHRLLLYRQELNEMLSFDLPVSRSIRSEVEANSSASRFEQWLRTLAFIWANSELKVDMAAPFCSYVALCWPDRERCLAVGLKAPKPLGTRTVVDWVNKVRHEHRRKL